jgi:DNA-binding transcriptional LysR family regulator
MDMVRLRYFLTVAKTGSVTKAAELLCVSPPAISKGIKTLEGELGVKLLVQNGRMLGLSTQGERLLLHGSPILRSLESLRARLNAEPSNSEPFRIGSFCEFSSYFVGYLTSQGLTNISIDIYDLLLPGQMEEALLNGSIDAAISLVPMPHPKLEFLKVCSTEHAVYGLVNQFEGVAFNELPFVVPAQVVEGSPRPMPALDGWPEDKIPRQQKYRVTLMETGLELCRRGRAVGYFAKFVIDLHNAYARSEFRLVPIESANQVYQAPETDVFLVKRKFTPEDQRIKKLTKAMRTITRPNFSRT